MSSSFKKPVTSLKKPVVPTRKWGVTCPLSSDKKTLAFFLLSFAISWVLWAAPVLENLGIRVPQFLLALSMGANFGPFLAAVILVVLSKEKQGLRTFFRQNFHLRFPLRWLWLSLFLAPAIGGVTYLTVGLFTPLPELPFLSNPWSIVPQFFFMFFASGALGEEPGWRGFALPRLLKAVPMVQASFLLGFLHALWHLPLFFMAGTTQSFLPFWQFLAIIVVNTFIYTILFQKSNGSLWVALGFHTTGNLSAWMFPVWQVNAGRWVLFGYSLLFVILFLLLDRTPKKTR
ncbi:MAG TPA: CPBP family intramembrane metalloprotease [Thermotogota bacterium]|nr:CPBP family intramembrane metalloprotease [Thermotogota bacterium]